MENIKELFLEGEAFEDARQKFNVVLQRLFKSMVDTGSTEGSITLKMDVSMKREYIPNNDPDIEGETREVKLPELSYKVNSSITVKDEQKGNNNPQMELVWDDEQQKYVLQYVANTSQRSIFDKDFQEAMKNEDAQEAIDTDLDKKWMNVAQIEGPVADEGALPGSVDGDPEIIDGDFREVEPEVETDPEVDPEDEPETADPDSYQDDYVPEEIPIDEDAEAVSDGGQTYFHDDEEDTGYNYEDPEE